MRFSALVCLATVLPLAVSGCSMGSIAFSKQHPSAALTDTVKKPGSKPEVATAALDAGAPDTEVLAYAAAPGPSASVDALVVQYALFYGVPESLVRRVIVRESKYNPGARNGPYWGLMQIRHDTAKAMGYDGPASGLLDAETNLKYAVKYLRGAYLCADGNPDRAVSLYASGYYYVAKHKGLLQKVGLI